MGQNESTAAENSAARDFTMARLAACRAALASAAALLDEALGLFVDTGSDRKGKERSELLEAIDANIGDAARAVQLAQSSMGDVDPEEGEPEDDEDPEDEPEDDDE